MKWTLEKHAAWNGFFISWSGELLKTALQTQGYIYISIYIPSFEPSIINTTIKTEDERQPWKVRNAERIKRKDFRWDANNPQRNRIYNGRKDSNEQRIPIRINTLYHNYVCISITPILNDRQTTSWSRYPNSSSKEKKKPAEQPKSKGIKLGGLIINNIE